ncbi:MAG: hypothetical protein IPL46_06140 [Saprospiraceae bacterium]|nr:hypothetical protein [Saprospiraceae bacterium]
MDQFDKNIQKKLSKGPDRKPDPKVWQQVREGLGSSTTGGGGMYWGRWLTTTALVLFLCSIAYFLGQKNSHKDLQFRQQLDELSQVVAGLKALIRDTIYIRDTFWHLPLEEQQSTASQVIQHVPSGSRVSIRQDHFTQWQDFTYGRSQSFLSRRFSFSPWLVSSKVNAFNPWQGRSSRHSDSDQSALGITLVPIKSRQSLQNITSKSIFPEFHSKPRISLHTYRALHDEEIIQQGRRRKIWDTILPDQHRIALMSGALNALTQELENPGEWLVGLQHEMSFSPRFSVLSGVRYRYFSAKNEHGLEDVQYPRPADLIADDQLHEIYISNHYISIPFLVKYSIPLGRHFRPYLQSGMLFTKAISQNYKFEIIRQGMDLNLNSKIGSGPMILSSYVFGAGFEYWLSPSASTSLDLEGRYQFKLSNIEFQKTMGLEFA